MKSEAKKIFDKITEDLCKLYEKEEAKNMSFWIMEEMYQLQRSDILASNTEIEVDTEKLNNITQRLLQHEPLQYIFRKGYFYGRTFKVSPFTLIPRPETEELVYYIIQNHQTKSTLKILDIGTGTGCIPITLSLEMDQSEVIAIDISKEALQVAQENNQALQASVTFLQKDILKEDLSDLPKLDIIVSNPPYVTQSEKQLMRENVLAYEPELALFVEDNNPLLFYKRITALASEKLTPGGWLYFEINEQFAKETEETLADHGFTDIQTLKDMQGKDRMTFGRKIEK